MFFYSFGGWVIIFLNTIGYFIFRFGMVSRGYLKDLLTLIEFVGGTILLGSFILMFYYFGLKNGLLLIPIFWFITTPIVEVLIGKMQRKLSKPYQKIHG